MYAYQGDLINWAGPDVAIPGGHRSDSKGAGQWGSGAGGGREEEAGGGE